MRSTDAYSLPYPLPGATSCPMRPLPRHDGAKPPRASLVATMRQAASRGDAQAERDSARMLAQLCLSRGVHVGDAVSVLLRALELLDSDDDHPARREAAAHLAALGRHDEASDLLRGAIVENEQEALELGLAAADAAARDGDASGAAVIYRELALSNLEDHRPLERLASIASFSPDSMPPDRASEVWLELASRASTPEEEFLALARAFDCAPGSFRAAAAFGAALSNQGRHECADEVLREHGRVAGSVREVAEQRVGTAIDAGAWPAAVGAIFDFVGHGGARSLGLQMSYRLRDRRSRAVSAPAEDSSSEAGWVEAIDAMTQSDALSRARALDRASESVRGPELAACLALASEAHLEAGNPTRARKLAMKARAVAPLAARPCSLLFAMALDGEVPLRELEDALALLPARGEQYRTLARLNMRAGAHTLAELWFRRALSLRRGDTELRSRALAALRGSASSLPLDGVATRAMEAASAPYPVDDVASGLARVIDAVADRDARRAAILGRSLLQLVGPHEPLVHSTLRAANASGETACAAETLLLHAIAGGSEHADRWLAAIDLALEEDVEAAAAHLSQAATVAVDGSGLRERIEKASSALGGLLDGARSDARLDLATARAWLSEVEDAPEVAADRWRDLGALRWDLARDPIGAEEAFFCGCLKTPEYGVARYLFDLMDRGGIDDTFERAQARVLALDESEEHALAASLLAELATIALSNNRRELAAELAASALERGASRFDALAVLESIASEKCAAGDHEGAVELLSRAYRSAANSASGRHGARAAWHRGARTLEALGEHRLAFDFALEAVLALPAHGAPLRLVKRIFSGFEAREGAAAAIAIRTEVLARLQAMVAAPDSGSDVDVEDRLDGRAMRLIAASLLTDGPLSPTNASPKQRSVLADDSGIASPPPTPKGRTRSSFGDRRPRTPDAPDLSVSATSAELTPLEVELERAGQFAELASSLCRDFVDDGSQPARARSLEGSRRLKAATIFASRLRDFIGACAALEDYVADEGVTDVEATRQLALWYEQRELFGEAAEKWARVLSIAPDLDRKVQAAVKACDGFLSVGDVPRARACLECVEGVPRTVELTLLELSLSTTDEAKDARIRGGEGDEDGFELPEASALEAFGVSERPASVRLAQDDSPPASKILGGDSLDRDEISLLEDELAEGVFEAGDLLARLYDTQPEANAANLIAVRRRQCMLRPGDVTAVDQLIEALKLHGLPWEVEAAQHVREVLLGLPPTRPPPLSSVAATPALVERLAFGHLAGTVNDALGMALRGGLFRNTRMTCPPAGLVPVTGEEDTALGRLYRVLSGLIPDEGVRLFHRDSPTELKSRMSIREPRGAVVEGRADAESCLVQYVVGSALAASTSPCAFAEGLELDDLEKLVSAFLTAFGPIPEGELSENPEPLSAQLVQDLWSAASGDDERRMRELCYDPARVSSGVARHLSSRARRRLGMIACGDLQTAVAQTAAELDLGDPERLRAPEFVRELLLHPSVANLLELALSPEYAECRWRRKAVLPMISVEGDTVS